MVSHLPHSFLHWAVDQVVGGQVVGPVSSRPSVVGQVLVAAASRPLVVPRQHQAQRWARCVVVVVEGQLARAYVGQVVLVGQAEGVGLPQVPMQWGLAAAAVEVGLEVVVTAARTR